VASVTLTARSALFGEATPGRYGARRDGAPEVKLAVRSGLALAMIAARKEKVSETIEAVAALSQARPLDRPSCAAKNGVAFIGCAPGQWLAVAGGSHAAGFVANLTQALGPVASVTDHTSAKTVVRISGARAREVLAKGCPIDLHPRVFKPGDAATTRIVLIGCTLWQVDGTPTYDLAVNSSIVRSFWSWLTASAAEYGYEIVRAAPQG
jgi:sarcosine oxidase subunit gamma